MRKYKKSDLKRDEFKETIENLIIYYGHHKKLLIWSVVGIVLISVLLFSFRNYVRNTREQARNQYNMAVVIYNNGQLEQALQQFEVIKREFLGTNSAHRATFMLADIYFKNNLIDKALGNFEQFVNGKYDELFTPSAYQGIAQCYEQKGNIIKALNYYEKAMNEFKSNTFKIDCLMQIGRIYFTMNRLNDAKNAYKEVTNLTDNPTIRYRAERKLKSIEAIKELSE